MSDVNGIREHLDKLPKKAAEEVISKMDEISAAAAERNEAFEKLAASMGKVKVQFGLLGVGIGVAVGGLASFAIAYRKAETKFSQIADEQISEMREYYQTKGRILEADRGKGDLKEIVKERGYSSPDVVEESAPPMAVQPPEMVIVPEEAIEDRRPRTGAAVEVEQRNVFEDAEVTHDWDWHKERSRRSTDIPYVVHYDEREEFDSYTDVTLTYYEGDDVLCNERDEIIDPTDRERLVGEKNLERFGHGSNDASIVYIRNDTLEILYEVVKSPNSYAQEVHGFRHDAVDRRNLERMRARERDEQDD